MDGGGSRARAWISPTDAAAATEAGPPADVVEWATVDDDDAANPDRRPLFAALAAAVLALAWLGTLGFARWPLLVDGVTLDEAIALVTIATPPLILIGLGYLLAVRTSRSEARRLARVSGGLRAEQERLEAVLLSVSGRIDAERADIAAQASQLLTIGDEAAMRLRAVGDGLRGEIEALVTRAEALRQAASGARGDMQTLIADLPRIQADTATIRETIDTAGLRAHGHAAALDAQVSALVVRGREADEIAGGAAQKLAAQLGRIEGISATASERLVEAAATMTDAIDGALARSADAADAARQAMEAQAASMLALVEAGEAALARTGAEASAAVAERVAEVAVKIDGLGHSLHAHYSTGAEIFVGLTQAADVLTARVSAADVDATARADRMRAALVELTGDASELGQSLAAGGDAAERMVTRVGVLHASLVDLVGEFDRALPTAFARVDEQVAGTTDRLTRFVPAIEAAERSSLSAATALAASDERITAVSAAAAELARLAADAATTADALSESAAPRLVEALVRVRDTAQVAADRARHAIEAAIPTSAERLRDAIGTATTAEIETQLRALGDAAKRAVASASTASDRLMRQMLTIAETSAQVEVRIAEAHAEIESADSDGFARRVALLIESLNSTAIDVSRIMATDVSDATWAAYLKGDRGVFTRRAVRLLDAGQSRDIARHYGEDGEFRAQVNRYVHDFEALLRNVLANRSGNAMSVALLSSDMGKLYVALAQAIERLRS